jgi:pimeloyl-ACP methyl ester carboxylesterase
MAAFTVEHLDVNGVDTAVLTAGEGEPLLFLHGAGTVTGFDALLPLAERFRLIVPHHPGFGASVDDESIDNVHDYRRHYLDLLDQLELGEVSVVGHSMGGWIATSIAVDHGERVRRLVLAAPFGLRVPEHPTVDFFVIPDEEVLGHLSADMSVYEGHVPMPPTPEFLAERFRESTSAARLLWERTFDPKLHKWLHRVTMPTLLLWGDADRIIPVEQLEVWAGHIPGAETKTLGGVGHLMFDESREAVDSVGDFVGEELKV